MTTRARLRALVALAETGSVRQAAESLVLTESTVSAAITALARELGVGLVEPEGRGVRLTPAGAVYAEYAGRILGLQDEAVAAALGVSDPTRGVVRVAAVTTAGEYLLPGMLAGFRRQYPDVEVRLEVGPRRTVWALLDDHRADIAVAGRPPSGSSFRTRATRPNALIVVGAPTGTDTWLLRERGSGTRETALALMATLETEPASLTLGSQGAAVAGAVAGLGLTLTSAEAVREHLDAGRLREIPVPGTPMERPWHLVTGPRPTATAELLVRWAGRDPAWSSSASSPSSAER